MRDFVVVSNTRLGVSMGVGSLILAAIAPLVVHVIAPGLTRQHFSAAVIMLRIMSPVLMLSGASHSSAMLLFTHSTCVSTVSPVCEACRNTYPANLPRRVH